MFSILSTPGYASFDLNHSTLNCKRCLADILENTEENRIQNLLSNNDTSVLENDSNEIPNQNLEKSILEKI